MLFIYKILINIVFTLSPIILIVRLIKNKEDPSRFKEKFGFFSKNKKYGKLIWFHGASVGELQSVIPLIERFEKNKSVSQILITSNTVSSSNIIKKFNLKKKPSHVAHAETPYPLNSCSDLIFNHLA